MSFKKLISLVVAVTMVCTCTCFAASAEFKVSDSSYQILTGYRDGSPEKIRTYYPQNKMTSMANKIKEAYCPPHLKDDSSIAPKATRSKVDASQYPYCAIGYMVTYYDTDGNGTIDTEIRGTTASLQAPDILISAAHCFFDSSLGGWPVSMEFHPAKNSSGYSESEADWVSASISQAYADGPGWVSQEDWVIIQIDQPLGKTYGWFGLHGCSEVEVNAVNVELSGYPEDKGGEQWRSAGKFTGIDNNVMIHNMYSIGGLSGSPVFDSEYSVYAIHILDYGTVHQGGATRMNDWLFGMIVEAAEESEQRWP